MNLNPFARLPKSWADDSTRGWAKIINLLHDKGEDMKVEAVDTFHRSSRIFPVNPLVPESKLEPGVTISSEHTQAVRDIAEKDHTDRDILPPEAIELDLLDCDVIPTLIAGILRGSNVNEFLERLGVLACTGMHWVLYVIDFFFTKCFRKGQGEDFRGQPILFGASTSLFR
jgi:hypothetical protein